MAPIRLLVAERNITRFRVDAIVNSADSAHIGRGGLNGQIHQVAGPGLLRASRALRGRAVGSVKLTIGYGLPATYVLHALAPTAHGPSEEEQRLLAQCYRRALALANQRRFRTVVFPVLGSGEHGFPFVLAATIALTEIQRHLDDDATLEHVIVTVYDDRGYELSNLAKDMLGYYMDEGWKLAGKIRADGGLCYSPLVAYRHMNPPHSPRRRRQGLLLTGRAIIPLDERARDEAATRRG